MNEPLVSSLSARGKKRERGREGERKKGEGLQLSQSMTIFYYFNVYVWYNAEEMQSYEMEQQLLRIYY